MKPTDLEIGQILTNDELSSIFFCGREGKIRVSETEKLIIVIADFDNPVFKDHWEGNLLHFTASGQTGDQSLESSPNLYLHDSTHNGIGVVLFESYFSNQYTYRGIVAVRGVSQGLGLDQYGNEREIDIFLLHPIRYVYNKSELTPILSIEIEISDDERYWQPYLRNAIFDLEYYLPRESFNDALLSSIWREYASRVLDIFVLELEKLGPQLIIPEYDLERGSIKGVLAIMVAVTTIASQGVSAVAKYPDAQKAWPVLQKDAEHVLKQVELALQSRFDAATVRVKRKSKHRPPHPNPYAAISPTIRRKHGENLDGA